MTKRIVALAGLLTATALAQPALSGTAVAWRDSSGSVQVDTDEIRCTISTKGVVSGSHKTFPGAFGAVLRNRKGEGVAGSTLDGNIDNWPTSLFVQDSCRQTLELLEDGPLRIVARCTLQGVAKNSPTGSVLKIDRLLTTWADSGTVFTEFHFGSKTPVAYPWAMLSFTDPETRKTADVLDFVTSSGAAGKAPTHTNGQWLAARLETEPAWTQLQVGDVTFGYVFPPGGALEGKTFTSGTGEQATDLRTLAYRGTCCDGPAYAWPLALVFADENRLGGDWAAKHVADRYFPDGRPRGVVVRTRPTTAGAIAIEVAETAGLNRNNVGLEQELPAMPASAVLRLEAGTVLGYQFKNHDPSTRTIAFQLPELKANETAVLHLAQGEGSGMQSSLRESWSRTQRSTPLDGPPSPHIAWAKPRTSRLQAFFFTDWSRCRDLFELQQRLDMDCDYALTAAGELLKSDSLWLRGAGRKLGEADEARRLLGNFRHDVIVIPDPRTYSSLPDDLKARIREKVMEGAGLVLLNGAELPDAVVAERPACLAGSKVTVKTLGRGRIAASPEGCDFDVMPKAMLWAAGVVPAAQIERVDFPAAQVRGVPATATLELRSALRTNADYRLEAMILGQADEVVAGTNRLVMLRPGVNQVTWELDGNHRADNFRLGFILRDLDGNALDYSCRNFGVESKAGIADIIVGTNTLRVGESLSGACQVSGSGVLTLSLKDTWGRVLQRQTLEARGEGGGEVPFSFPAIETETFLLALEAELADAAGPVARKSLDIHISRPRRVDDLRIEAYMLRDCAPLALERLREAGVDAGGVYFSKAHEPMVLAMRRNNVDIIANMTYGMPGFAPPPIREGEPNQWPAPANDDPHNIRMWDKRPSCPQAERFAWAPGAYRRSAGDMPERYSPFAYDLCDEYMFQRHVYDLKGGWPYDELCYCRHSLEAFRAWLRDSYGTLESLNRQWDTAYGAWEDVVPPPARMARLKDNVSAWLDFRIFLAEDVARRLAAKQNGELPPGASASANVLYEGPFSSFMTWYLFGPGGLNASDCYPDTLDKARSSGRHPESRRIVLGYTAWGETTEKFFGNCWRNVLHGGGRIGVYNATETFMDSSVLTPTYGEGELWGKVRRIRRALGDSGIAKMMLTSQPAPERVGVLQSYRSGFAAFLEPRNYDEAGWLAVKDGFARHFDGALAAPGFAAAAENSQLGWRYLADEQLSAPGMAGLDAILVPGASCVSDGAIAALADFVAKGGLLVADFHFADFDGRGKPRSDFAAVNALFGMRKDKPNWSRTKQELSIDMDRKRTVESAGRDEKVQVAAGEALGRYADDVPALILARHGKKGTACYLNAALPGRELKDVVSWLLDDAGLRSEFRIVDEDGAPVSGHSLFARRNGDIQYLSVLGAGERDSGRRFLALPRPRQVYDVLEQKDLGITDRVEFKPNNAEGAVFAMPPYKVGGVQLALDKKAVKQGEAIEYRLKLRTGSASPGAHVVRLEVYDPLGRLCPYWTRNVLAEGGRYRGRMVIALNETAGAWRVRAIDAMSGKAHEGRFTVESDR